MKIVPAYRIQRGGTRKRVLRNLILLGGSNGIASVLMLLVVAINSRALSLADFGVYVLLQTTALLIAGLFNFATQQPVIKIGLDALERGEVGRFERLIAMGFVADATSAICAAALATGIVLAAPTLLGLPPDRASAALIVAGSLLFQGYRTSEGVFRAFDRFSQLGLIQVLASAVQLVLATWLWWTDAAFASYAWLVAVTIALPALGQFAGALLLLARSGMRPRFAGLAGARADLREFVAYCWTTWATGTCDSIRQYGDAPLVGAMISVEAAGIYNVAKQLAGVMRKASMIYASVLFPELATFASRRDFAGARRIFRKVIGICAALTAVMVGGSALVGGIALELLFGPAFAPGHFALVLLFAAAGVQLLSATYSMYVQAFDGPVGVFYAYLAASAAFIATIAPALWAIGLAGAGIAQLAFFAVLSLACAARLRRSAALKGDHQ